MANLSSLENTANSEKKGLKYNIKNLFGAF